MKVKDKSNPNIKINALEKQGFLKFISYLQIIGIILVVVGHSFHEYPDGDHGFSLLFYRLCFSFRMPLFLFVSGFLMVYTTKVCDNPKIHPKAFVLSKIRRLLLPMAVLTILTIMPRSMMSFAADEGFELNLQNIVYSFLDRNYMPIPFFWFLHASFILLAITFCILYIGNNLRIKSGYTILCLLAIFIIYSILDLPTTTFLSISDIKRIGLFFFLGAFYGAFHKKIDSIVPWRNLWLLSINVILWGVSFWLFENSSLRIICSFFGILMWISVAKIIEYKEWKFLDHLRGANYLIFLLSWYFNILSQQVLAYYFDLPWWIHTILSIILGIYVPYLGYVYLKKRQDSYWVRITSYLLGQSFKKA